MNWRLVFEQSRVNGAVYRGDDLIQRVYRPVTNSWFQKRLNHVRAELKKEMIEAPDPSKKSH